ncbi:MAG: hypothetical protein ACLSFB_07995 [[Clostridium] scindens]
MRLTKKTLCYSVLISAVLMAFVVVYFCFMMPSLYVDYAQKDDLKSVVDVQKGYMKNRSYKGLTVKNPTGSMSVEIPPFRRHGVYRGKELPDYGTGG